MYSFVLALSLASLSLVLQPGSQQPPKPSPPAADLSQEAFVIEEYVSKFRFEDDGTGRREGRARIKVQSDAGVQAFGQLVFGYSAGTEKLEIEYVRVRKADGSIVTAPLETAVQDLTSPVQQVAPVYTDFRQKHVTVPGLRPGETLEYSVITTIHTPLAAGHFWTEYDFQRDAIVLDEQLEVDVPAARTITLKTAPEAAPRISESNGRRIYRWISAHKVREPEKDEETLRKEAEAELDNPRRAAVRLTTFQSWDEVGRWYRGLEKESRTVTEEIRRKAEELTAGRKTALEKLEALYDFVAPGFRYVSISLGMGRYQPRVAADVLRDQYGDCKDKHTLLAALMEAVGLQASTVLIHTDTKIDPSFPSPSQFDHVITTARADGQEVWLDVTTEVAPFRLLSANLRKKQALVVSADRSALVETPADPPMPMMMTQELDGALGPLGTLTGMVKITTRGDVELLLRNIFYRTPEAQWKQVLEGFSQALGVGGEISDWKVSDPKATDEAFQLEFKVSKTGFVDWSKKTTSFKLPLSSLDLPAIGETTTRSEIDLGTGGYAEYRVTLQLGDDYKGRAPIPVSLKRDYATYVASYTLEGQRFTARRRIDMLARSLPADRGGDYRSFRRAVLADTQQTLTVDVAAAASDAPAPDLKASELLRGGQDAIKARNYPQAVTLLKRAVELEPKNTRALNFLGDAYLAQRQYDDALAAYNEILRINPYDEVAHSDVGHAYRMQGRYTEAEAAFRKQLDLTPLDPYANTVLGELLLSLKRHGAAAEQLQKALSLQPEDAYVHVNLGTAYLNSGKDDEALAAFTKAVELAPNPLTWNNVAYQLALKGVHLDRALQYAESALTTAAVASRTFTLDHVSARELSIVSSIASYWDTLGWVYYAKGDLTRAERLVSASWALEHSAEVGDHLAQIYEKQGRKADAIRQYAIAMNADRAQDETRQRLAALAGADAQQLIERHRPDLLALRTLAIQGTRGVTGMADFVVLIGEDGRAQAAKFVSGEEKLRPMDTKIQQLEFGPALPAAAPAKILRRGTLSCTASGCSFVLFPASHAQPVQ